MGAWCSLTFSDVSGVYLAQRIDTAMYENMLGGLRRHGQNLKDLACVLFEAAEGLRSATYI